MIYSVQFYDNQKTEWVTVGEFNSYDEAEGAANYYFCRCDRAGITGDIVVIDNTTGEILYYIDN